MQPVLTRSSEAVHKRRESKRKSAHTRYVTILPLICLNAEHICIIFKVCYRTRTVRPRGRYTQMTPKGFQAFVSPPDWIEQASHYTHNVVRNLVTTVMTLLLCYAYSRRQDVLLTKISHRHMNGIQKRWRLINWEIA